MNELYHTWNSEALHFTCVRLSIQIKFFSTNINLNETLSSSMRTKCREKYPILNQRWSGRRVEKIYISRRKLVYLPV